MTEPNYHITYTFSFVVELPLGTATLEDGV
jgi:hypothetical protein